MGKVSLLISSILSALLIIISVLNLQPVNMSFFGTPEQLSLGLLPISGVFLGAWIGLSITWLRSGTAQTQKKKLDDWQVQDAELAASVQTDREKQLQAKIATLETALKAALKKSS